MGNLFSYPYAFRRAIASLHYEKNPFPTGGRELKDFWRTMFCRHMTEDEFASHWTPEDVRLLRLYHPGRLAVVLLLAMRHLEAFVLQGTGRGKQTRDRSTRAEKGKETSGTRRVRFVVDEEGHDATWNSEAPKDVSDKSERPSIDCTCAINSLRLIAGALPYCFEDIGLLKKAVEADQKETSRNELNIGCTSQHTQELMSFRERTESPFAADFAYHLFVRDGKCFRDDDPIFVTKFYADLFCSGTPADAQTDPLGTRLVGVLVELLFVPNFTQTRTPRKMSTKQLELQKAIAVDIQLLHLMKALTESECSRKSHLSTADEVWAFSFQGTLVGEARALVLRTILLALSASAFSSKSNITDVSKNEPISVNTTRDVMCSCAMRKRVSDVMLCGLFDSRRQPLSVLLCVLLLHVVRCYPKWPVIVPSLRIVWGANPTLSGEMVDILSHSLAIIAIAFYSGPNITSYRYSGDVETSDVGPNILWRLMFIVMGGRALSTSSQVQPTAEGGGPGEPCGANEVGTPSLPEHEKIVLLGKPFRGYWRSFVDGVLALLETPLISNGPVVKRPESPCTCLALHLMLWLLQNSEFSAEFVGRKPRLLLVLVHNIVVICGGSSTRLGEGQIACLCILLLLRSTPFLQLLMKPLPAVGDGSAAEVSEQRMQAEQFLCELSVAMPILPTNVTVVGTKLKKRKKARASGTLYLRTYCDILVLCLCYVISPSSPQWFTSLYRSAVEILYTLQVCFPRGTGGRLPCDFLAEHSLFEIASSFSHLSSVFILSRGVETQRACAQMAKAIRLIICSPATRPPVRPTVTQPDVQDSVGEGGGDAVPLVWSLATQSTLLDLHKLISKSEHSTGSSSGLLSSLELSSKLKILNARHVRNRSMFCGKRRGPKQFDVRKLEIVADLGTSDELCLLSRLAVSVAENMEKTLALKRKRSGNPAAEERVSSPTNNLSGKWVVKGERRLWHKRDNGLRRQISDLVTKVWNDASRSPAGGEVAVSSFQGASAVRKILVPCGSAAERWLLGKLWLQIHRVNDKLPMFDYRTATVISE